MKAQIRVEWTGVDTPVDSSSPGLLASGTSTAEVSAAVSTRRRWVEAGVCVKDHLPPDPPHTHTWFFLLVDDLI